MPVKLQIAAIRLRIEKAERDRDTWRASGSQEKYLEASSMVEALGMTPTSRERLDTFWELLDEILNAVLFVMIGLELLRLNFNITYAWAAALAIPAVLAARFLSVGLAALVPSRSPTWWCCSRSWCRG